MAETTTTVEDIKALIESSPQFRAAMEASGISIDDMKNAFISATLEIKAFGAAFTKNFSHKELIKKTTDEFKEYGYEIKESAGSFNGLIIQLGMLSPIARKALAPFDSLSEVSAKAKDTTTQISEMANKLEEMGLIKGPVKYLTDAAKFADASRNMENQIIKSMSAAGHFNDVMGDMEGTFAGLGGKVVQFSKETADIGTNMGLTSNQVAGLAGELMQLPGVYGQVVRSSNDTGDSFHVLDAAIRVARGTGQDYSDVIEDVTKMTMRFGSSSQTALETISRMHSATQVLGMRMGDLRKFVTETGEQFKFFGDNSSSAIDIMARFAPALKAGGLAPEAIKELVGGLTSGVSKMGVAQRAFLSSQAGIGGGGLAGGLEVEEMLANGNSNEVVGQIISSLEAIAGPFMSRQDAISGGPGAVAQFELQRSLLQSGGPFGQLAGSPEEAAQLLGALSKGDEKGLAEKIKAGNESLKKTMEDGKSIADHQNNILIKSSNELSKIHAVNSLSAASLLKMHIGIDALTKIKPYYGIDQENKARGHAPEKDGRGFASVPAELDLKSELADIEKLASTIAGSFTEPVNTFMGSLGANKPRSQAEKMLDSLDSGEPSKQEGTKHTNSDPFQFLEPPVTPEMKLAPSREVIIEQAAEKQQAINGPTNQKQGGGTNKSEITIVTMTEDGVKKIISRIRVDELGNLHDDDYGRAMVGQGQ